jgi:hypothetical protein
MIVPDEVLEGATIYAARTLTTGEAQEAGRKIAQPTLDQISPVRGDVRPALAGVPEVEFDGALSVNKVGVIERGRYGWMRAQDNEDTDRQVRQSPHIVGRRPDVLDYDANTNDTRYLRPKLVSLKSGDLGMIRATGGVWPIDRDYEAPTNDYVLSWRKLDKTNDEWSAATSIFQEARVNAWDAVSYPDTGEVVVVIGWHVGTGDRRLTVLSSPNYGSTWDERRRLFLDGAVPDVNVGSDTSFVEGLAAEVLPSGRLVVVMATSKFTYSLVSDDRGASFTATEILSHAAANQFCGHGVSSALARNGTALFVVAKRNGVNDTIPAQNVNLYMTANGEDFTSLGLVPAYATVDVSICISPDGFPHLYGTVHATIEASPTFKDWLWGRRFKTRDPRPGDALADLFPGGTTTATSYAFHTHEGVPSGTYEVAAVPSESPPTIYHGFVGVDSITHRGQVVLAVVAHKDLATDTERPGSKVSSALVVYRVNHWQPIRDALLDVRSSSLGALVAGRVYNRTWDAYGLPDAWGFTVAGAGAASITAGGDEGGYLELTGTASKYYTDETLPDSETGFWGALRVVVQVTAGGSLLADDIAIKFALNRTGSAAGEITVRFEKVGGSVNVRMFNAVSGAAAGAAVVFTSTSWIEVLLAFPTDGVATSWSGEGFAREYVRDDDPDWDAPYTSLGTVSGASPSSLSVEFVSFGHFTATTSSTRTSRWKGVHLHRRTQNSALGEMIECGFTQLGLDDPDEDTSTDWATQGRGESEIDNGVDNFPRAPYLLAQPAQFLSRDVFVQWRGEATTRGLYDFEVRHDFEAENVALLPIAREWRSDSAGVSVELIFDSDEFDQGRVFRPDAIAFFGRNFPGATVSFSDSPTVWTPGDVPTYVLGYFGSPMAEDRFTHLWAMDVSHSEWSYWIDGTRLTVFGPASMGRGPWRPHQFASRPSGPRHYVVFTQTDGDSFVYRVKDNDESTLIFETPPSMADVATGGGTPSSPYVFPFDFAIYSDRFAVLFEHNFGTTQYPSGPTSFHELANVHGYRYMRILIRQVTMRDADENFYRLGRVIVGQAIDLGESQIEWGFTSARASGFEISDYSTGATKRRRLHATRREVSLDLGVLDPPAEVVENYLSPEKGYSNAASWAHWLDAVRRLEVDGSEVAFVWAGDRAYAEASETVEPVASDVEEVFLARVVDAGSVEHVAFKSATLNLSSGDAEIPVPYCKIRGVKLREEL